MLKVIGTVFGIWILVIFAYIFLAVIMPGIVSITDDTATNLAATSNMSNYPGTKQAIQAYPLWAWFIPGGIGLGATAVFLKEHSREEER